MDLGSMYIKQMWNKKYILVFIKPSSSEVQCQLLSERFNESLEFPSSTFPELIQHLHIDMAKPFDPTSVNLSAWGLKF